MKKTIFILAIALCAFINSNAQFALNFNNGNLSITDSRNKQNVVLNGVQAFQYDSTTNPKTFTFVSGGKTQAVLYTTITSCVINGNSQTITPALTLANAIQNYIFTTTTGGGGGGGGASEATANTPSEITTQTATVIAGMDDADNKVVLHTDQFGNLYTQSLGGSLVDQAVSNGSTDGGGGSIGASSQGILLRGFNGSNFAPLIKTNASGNIINEPLVTKDRGVSTPTTQRVTIATDDNINVTQQDTVLVSLTTQSLINMNLMQHQVTGTSYLNFNNINGKAYRSFVTQIIGTVGISAGAVIFEESNDGTKWNNIVVEDRATGLSTTGAITIASGANRFFRGVIAARFVRCRISTAFTGGTVQAVTDLSTDFIPTRATSLIASFNSTLPTTTSGNQQLLQTDVNGRLLIAFPLQGNTDVVGTITTGGTAQQIMPAASRKGWWIQNNSAGDLFIRIWNTAALDQGFRIPAGGMLQSPNFCYPNGSISIWGATTGQKFTYIDFQ